MTDIEDYNQSTFKMTERQAFDVSVNNVDFEEFDLSTYDRRQRLNARVQTAKQALLHELSPEMFDEVAPLN